MPQAVVRPSLAIADERTERRPGSDAVRGFDGRGSHGQSRAIATAANHGRRQESTGGNARDAMHAHSEPAQPVTGRQQRRRVQAVPFHAHKSPPWHSPPVEFKSDARRLWAHGTTLGPRKCGLSGAITAPKDRFHVITQLNARDGPAKGRTSVLIDEERVLETRAEPSARNDRSMRTSTGQSPGQLHRWMRRVARLGLPSLLAQCPWQAPVPPVHASLDGT